MKSFNQNIGVLKFHYTSKKLNIGNWKLFYDEKENLGTGFKELKNYCETLPQNLTTVIYCKDLKLFYIVNKNEKIFEFEEGRIKADGFNSFDFFTLKTKDETIEFREWKNWFDKIDEPAEFHKNFKAAMQYLNYDKIDKFGIYTLSHECFKRGIQYAYKDYAMKNLQSMKSWVEKTMPQDEDTIDFFEDYWRGGFAFYNAVYKDQVLKNITSFDKKSCHSAIMIFEKFPCESFVDLDLNYWNEVQKDFDITAFIANMKFEGLRQKKGSIIGLDAIWRFGQHDAEGFWHITINEVDWAWFKEEFEWDKAYLYGLKIAHKNYLPKDMVKLLINLYNEKESYSKQDIRRQFAKQCTELCYGQSIKKVGYDYKAELDQDGNIKVEREKVLSLEEKQELLKRRPLPMSLGIWTVSYSRLDIWKAAKIAGSDATVYCDTDCIKTTRGKEIGELLNKEVEEKAKLAKKRFPKLEIPSTLGRWSFEYTADEFIVAGIKWYAHKENGTIKFKAAGAQLDVLEDWFRTHEISDFNTQMEVEGLFKQQRYDLKNNYVVIGSNNFFTDTICREQQFYETIVKR